MKAQSTCGIQKVALKMKALRARFIYDVYIPVFIFLMSTISTALGYPTFVKPIANITTSVGRDAIFACVVQDLGHYKVAWLRVDTQTILTIQNHLLTRNYRISVTTSEDNTWYLHIRDVRESDEGLYMCQINTDPMQMQVGFLNVVVSPDILDYLSSKDVMAREGENITLQCEAKGTPEPVITWKRETGDYLRIDSDKSVTSMKGSSLFLYQITRQDMGSYLCIASNGVPPSVSKRIMLMVNFSPFISVDNQLLSAYDSMEVVLRCYIEAYPRPINFWKSDDGFMILPNSKYSINITTEENYKHQLTLTIRNITRNDYGVYHCVSKNSLGEAELSIKLHEIENSSLIKDESKVTIYHSNLSQRANLLSQSDAVACFRFIINIFLIIIVSFLL